MSLHTLRNSIALATTNWVNVTAADLKSMGADARQPQATDRIEFVNIVSVAGQDVSLCYGPRTGGADGGTRGLIGVPHPDRLPKVCTLTFGTLTVELARDGRGDSGDRIDHTGLTRAALRTKIQALITAASTGVAGLTAADGPTDDLIVLQADSGETDSPLWSTTLGQPWAQGMTEATAAGIAAGATPDLKAMGDEVTSVIALRANVAGATVVLEVEARSNGRPIGR